MNRRDLLRLAKRARAAERAARKLKQLQKEFPVHECVDRPNLPCPACLLGTADAFATVQKERARPKKT